MISSLAILVLGATVAERCPAIVGGELSLATLEAERRHHYLAQLLEEESGRAELWSTLWGGAYASLTMVQLSIAPGQNKDDRIDSVVGGASSVVGIAQLVFLPLTIIEDGRGLRDRPLDLGAPCLQLADLEDRLIRGAESEAFGTSWVTHVGCLAFNLIIGAILGFGYGHWAAAAISAGVGVATGELMIWTQPDRLSEALQDYRQGILRFEGRF
ncbi:MAG: hypothetical protein U1E65_29115 [Myxococcota bacterium]